MPIHVLFLTLAQYQSKDVNKNVYSQQMMSKQINIITLPED